MVKINCTKCGKSQELKEFTCIECSEKELEEDKREWKCDKCGKDLFGRTADQEITLFYKDADKDYNFCSKDCLLKFIDKRLK